MIGSFDGTTTTYYLTDALGSVLMSFSNNAILGEQMYGPYGNTRYTAGTINTAKGYTGQIQNASMELDLLGIMIWLWIRLWVVWIFRGHSTWYILG